jgi:hypothetical protein
MKKCPSCDKTFDDAMRLCQVDGTPLVDAAEPVDPYKTMVAGPADLAEALSAIKADIPAEPKKADDEVLEIPPVPEAKVEQPPPPADVDPKKTMYASEAEIRFAMDEVDKQDVAPPEPAPPKFIAPETPTKPAPVDSGLPASPYTGPDYSKTTPPIPYPYDPAEVKKMLKAETGMKAIEPEPPKFVQPEPPAPAVNPFNDPVAEVNAPLANADKTPSPAASEKDWPKESMQNPQYQPGSAAPAAKQNQTLAIVSLILGILGTTICCGWFLFSIVALVTGFMARGKANSDPANYGGAGLAMVGIITGAIGIVLGIGYWVFLLFFGGMQMMMQGM